MLSKNYSAAIHGTEAVSVEIEVDSRQGLPGQTIVGLPDTAVRESRERVFSALKNSGYDIPINKYLTINLAPADLKKAGTLYDLPIALGILQSTSQLMVRKDERYLVAGELGLDGYLKPITGALLLAILAKEQNADYVMLPLVNAQEASLIEGVRIVAVETLVEAVERLTATSPPAGYQRKKEQTLPTRYSIDFSEVRGQSYAKRALEIAAAGAHNLFMVGPPGCGKSMLAKRLMTILPELTEEETIQVIKIYSVAGKMREKLKALKHRPFRSPHHTVSYAALIGGTSQARPGEVSLAHEGVLYLDEIPEFSRQALEALRQPMEDGVVRISRAQWSFSYPASFMLIASANPCPCGYATHPKIVCTCQPSRKRQYAQKFSGPLLDRFDLMVELLPVTEEEILGRSDAEPSEVIQKRVIDARFQQGRTSGRPNATLSLTEMDRRCQLDSDCNDLLTQAIRAYQMSTRSVHKTLKVARTIADLGASLLIKKEHVLEALHYRVKAFHDH
ncbi:MAG: YifB family Mg chelatase-like AAA ATPase [Candidatus Margulisiibacteriota bacterium]